MENMEVVGTMRPPARRARKPDSVDRARAWIREHGRLLDRKTTKALGFSHGTELAANKAEQAYIAGLKAGRADPLVDRSTLAKSARKKLDSAERLLNERVRNYFVQRRAKLDEEVNERVLKETKEHLAMLRKSEAEAERHKAIYQEFMEAQTKIFTREQFMLLMMCVHGGEVSPEKRKEAGQLLNGKRFALTGEKA